MDDAARLDSFIELLRHLREPLLMATPSGRIIAANSASAEALGTSISSLEGGSLAAYAVDASGLRERLSSRRERPFALRAADGRRFSCDARSIAADVLLLRLSGGPEAGPRAQMFLDTVTRFQEAAASEADGKDRGGRAKLEIEERGTTRLERLLAFTRTLARAITPQEVAEAVVDMGIAATGARSGGLWLLASEGSNVCLARAVGDGGPRPEDFAHVPIEPPGRMAILDAIRTASPVWIESCRQMQEQYPAVFRAFSRGEETALACLPLFAQGRCIGGLAYNFEGSRHFVEEERAFLQVLAWHSAQAIERSRLYAAEKRAREAAQASQRRSAFLADASTLLASSLDYSSTLARVASAAVPRVADWCIVELEDDRLRGAPAVGAHVDPSKMPFVLELSRRYRELGSRDHGIPGVMRTGRSQLYRSISPELLREIGDPELSGLFERTGIVSSMVVPIAARGRTLGAIVLNSADAARVYDEDDLTMAEELGRRTGLAVDNARLYQDAREADRQKDEFLAMLSHELRNPLAPIVTALELMKLRGIDAFANERSVIARNVRHIARLVDDLLDVARITRGKIQLHIERCEVSQVIAKAVEMVRPAIQERAQMLTVSAPAHGLVVDADPARLAQTIANLLANATKYTEPKGCIEISAESEAGEAVIRVRDSGIGIAAETLPRIFDLFVQEKRALDRSQGGLGIGLTVVRALVALHGGTVSASSKGLGQGSEFVVRLPIAASDAMVDAIPGAPSSATAIGAAGDRLRVLVVDDNEDAANMLCESLRARGYGVWVAYDGPSALSVASEFEPDLVLVDIGLPGMDGYELVGRLRRLEPPPRWIVAVTGYGHEEDYARSREAGFDEHIVKPMSSETLRAVLDRCACAAPSSASTPRTPTVA
jgi:signal transduction histidine kinase/ActR/RegA family two-component response regulator/PAS domain-containing protein